MLGTFFHLTNQCRRVSSAPSLLPEPICWQRFDAFHSNLLWISSAPQPGLNFSCSCFFCPLLPVDEPGPLQKHLLHVIRANVSHDQGVPLWPPDAPFTGLAHDRSWWTSLLPSRLDFKSLFVQSFFLFFWPFSNPHPF